MYVHMYLKCTVKCNYTEWIWKCEYCPNVNHLDVTCFRKSFWYSHKTERWMYQYVYWRQVSYGTHNVVRTKSNVTLTSRTTSRKFLLNIVDIWLMIRSNRVGMYNVMKFPVKGLAKLMSTNVPLRPYLSMLQNPRFLKKYLPRSSFPEYVTFLSLSSRLSPNISMWM